jgi:ketosteroid isomerase-like protein
MSTKTEENLEIVKTMIQNGLIGRYDVIRGYIADNYVCNLPIGLPYGGDFHGWNGYTEVFKNIVDFFSEIAFGPNEYIGGEDKVVVLSRLKGKLKRSGKDIDMPLVEVWTLHAGMVSNIMAFYYDTKLICDLNET